MRACACGCACAQTYLGDYIFFPVLPYTVKFFCPRDVCDVCSSEAVAQLLYVFFCIFESVGRCAGRSSAQNIVLSFAV